MENVFERLAEITKPLKINHGDAWGTGKDWFTFYCPNINCKKQLREKSKCPYCGQEIIWET